MKVLFNFLGLAAIVISCTGGPAWARLDNGGWMSRDLAISKDQSTVYATTVTDGGSDCAGKDYEPLTLWAFCANGLCPETCDGGSNTPCKWRIPICEARGTKSDSSDPKGYHASYAPPAVSADGKYIAAVSVNGLAHIVNSDGTEVYPGLDEHGHHNDYAERNRGMSFYARPVIDQWNFTNNVTTSGTTTTYECTGYRLYALSRDGRLAAWQSVPNCNADDEQGRWEFIATHGWPYRPELGGKPVRGPFLFEPLIDSDSPLRSDACGARIYFGSENSKEGLFSIDPCGSGADEPTTDWRCFWRKKGQQSNGALQTLTFTLGGTIDNFTDGDSVGGKKLLIANAKNGTVAINLDEPPSTTDCLADSGSGAAYKEHWLHVGGKKAVGNQDERTHRSYPTVSKDKRSIYLTGKGGAVIELLALNPMANGDSFSPQTNGGESGYFFPETGSIPDISFSSATANPHDGFVYFGTSKKGGIYRVAPLSSSEGNALPEDSLWFPVSPPDGWRTSPAFTKATGPSGQMHRIHIGSAKGRLYTIRLPNPAEADHHAMHGESDREWCWDTRTNKPCDPD